MVAVLLFKQTNAVQTTARTATNVPNTGIAIFMSM